MAVNKTLLCVDTSSKSGSLALLDIVDDKKTVFISEVSWEKAKSHSENITTNCMELLASAKRQLQDIKAIAVTVGPGSFTGIRVGLNFVRSLSYALQIPIYSFDSLAPLAFPFKDQSLPIVAMTNAHKNMIYASAYTSSPFSEIFAPCALTIEQLSLQLLNNSYLCVGDAYSIYENGFPTELKRKLEPQKKNSCSVAQTLGQMWQEFKQQTSPLTWNQALPLYIRSSEAEEKLWSGLLRPQLRQ